MAHKSKLAKIKKFKFGGNPQKNKSAKLKSAVRKGLRKAC